MSNFHISLPCESVEKTKQFYVDILGLKSGRETHSWIDINVFGNQITFAKHPDFAIATKYYFLDEKQLPIFHLGIILEQKEWKRQLEIHKGKNYLEIESSEFLKNKVGEHESFFIKDPNGYFLEFKTFKKPAEIFKQK